MATSIEALKIEPRAFTLAGIVDGQPTWTQPLRTYQAWISFSGARFTVQPGQWFSEEVTLMFEGPQL